MTLIVNAGAGAIPASGDGWANTYQDAAAHARRWLDNIRDDGIRNVTLELPGEDLDGGRWRFTFRHSVTGVGVDLDTHGIDNMAAYLTSRVFTPRVYWNGSSTSEPQLEDWVAPGFEAVKTFRAAAEGA